MFGLESSSFAREALSLFQEQVKTNKLYRQFVETLGVLPQNVSNINSIPFLPISFFKTHEIYTGSVSSQKIFESSGTTNSGNSRHYVSDLSLYEQSFIQGFHHFYGKVEDYTILALLPSYLERDNSSLVYMVDKLINLSQNEDSGFYLYNYDELYSKLKLLAKSKRKVLLIGVTFALLEFSEQYKINFPELIVMETGGMKGRRKELIREELHSVLCQAFGVRTIHSEYGMTELLSQAYSKSDGLYYPVPWMKVLIRDTKDPFQIIVEEQVGGLNIIDLANRYSCPFIATQDLGRVYSDGGFEVLGRFDNTDIRGCNLMLSL